MLRKRHADDLVRVFYQVIPLTISGKQIVSEVTELCGGRNVPRRQAQTPLVPIRSRPKRSLAADPEAMLITPDETASTDAWLRRDLDADRAFAARRQPSAA